MDYGEILGTTWKIVWKQKVLFGFGLVSMIAPILMGLLMGGFFIFFDPMTLEHSLGDFLGVVGIALIGGYLLFIAFSFVLHAIGTAGVLKGTMQAEGGVETLSFIKLDWRAVEERTFRSHHLYRTYCSFILRNGWICYALDGEKGISICIV